MEIVLVKQTDERLTGPDADAVRRFLFGVFKGATDKDTKAWYRFWRGADESSRGEYISIKVSRKRNGKFHNFHMALESAVFKGQEQFESFKIFRYWLKLGAGFVDYVPDEIGVLQPVPKSISYDECTEEEMRQFHDDALAFLHTERAYSFLWPSLSAQVAEQGMFAILEQFERPIT